MQFSLMPVLQMVANAGVFATVPFVDLTVEELDRMLRVNVRGTMLCFQHAARQMIKQGRGGRIIGSCHWNYDRNRVLEAHPSIGASSLAGKQGRLSSSSFV